MISVEQRIWTSADKWSTPTGSLPEDAQLVFVFGDRELIAQEELFQQVRQFYPEAYIVLSSTSGNILGDEVTSDSVTVSALHFEKTRIWFSETTINNQFDSKNVGKKLAEFLPTEDLVHSFVLSDGLSVNGSALVRSINEYLPPSVTVTGGLAGDGELFNETLVSCNSTPKSNKVALIGFYGHSLKVGYASKGGWKASDHTYTITRSEENILYELDGRPALDVYKELLGEKASKLPGSALLYPLQLSLADEGLVVRTVLGVDEETKSMTFAGDMPQDITANVMHSTEDDLIESARQAGEEISQKLQGSPAEFSLLVSCIGRRLVLKDRTQEEVQAAHKAIGEQSAIHGFYSYGELCPAAGSNKCLLHNQTMTITSFSEV